jgi:hypothetical protein
MLLNVLWKRLVILAWLTVGMLAVPLVHVHPEADHRHGQASHTHGGVLHTVISSDLPCEYGYDAEGTAAPPRDADGHSPVVGQSAHAFDHPEIGFSLLTSSPDRNSGKPALAQVAPLVAEDGCVHRASVFAAEPSVEPLASVILSANLSSRAPPLSAV